MKIEIKELIRYVESAIYYLTNVQLRTPEQSQILDATADLPGGVDGPHFAKAFIEAQAIGFEDRLHGIWKSINHIVIGMREGIPWDNYQFWGSYALESRDVEFAESVLVSLKALTGSMDDKVSATREPDLSIPNPSSLSVPLIDSEKGFVPTETERLQLKNGPVAGYAWHWEGKTFEKMRPKQWKLAKALWEAKLHASEYSSDFITTLGYDREEMPKVIQRRIQNLASSASQFFKSCGIPLAIKATADDVKLITDVAVLTKRRMRGKPKKG